jgi:hypothetical protein
MSRRPARTTQADIGRAIRAVEKSGARFEIRIEPDGVIRLIPFGAGAAEKPQDGKLEGTRDIVL